MSPTNRNRKDATGGSGKKTTKDARKATNQGAAKAANGESDKTAKWVGAAKSPNPASRMGTKGKASPPPPEEPTPSRRDAGGHEPGHRDMSDRVGDLVSRHPRKIVAVFMVLFVLSLPALANLSSFNSLNELLPTGDYYDANTLLNKELGSDNVMFVLTTPGASGDVTDVAALREADHLMNRFEEVPYVQATVSLPGLVKTMNFLTTGNYELPPDTPEGNERTRQLFQLSLDQFGEQLIYDNVLARDHSAGIQLIVMEKGHTLQQYRDWQVELKELGLEMDERNPYAGATENRPISIDVIYADLDAVAIDEGPLWILVALVVAVISSYIVLNRSINAMLLALFVLTIAIAMTVTAGYLVGVHFNLLTMLLIALILGVGIDYAMHVIARYHEERALGYDVKQAITQSARHVGSALFITMVTTVVGFVSLYFSRIQAIGQFGIMVGAGMLTAYLACILLLPALLQLRDERLIRQGKREAPPSLSVDEAESRRAVLEKKLRDEQQGSLMGRMAAANQRHPLAIVLISFAILGSMAGVIAYKGVDIWGASYIDPPILDEKTYPMEVLRKVDEAVGIPVEGAIIIEGDMTRPANLAYLERIEDEMLGRIPGCTPEENNPCIDPSRRDHGILNGMSTVGVVKLLYPTLGIPNNFQDDRFSIDSDGDGDQDTCPAGSEGEPCADGIPDTSAALRAFYDRLYEFPTIQGVMYRVLSDNYDYGVVRYNYAAQPRFDPILNPDGSLGTDVSNFKASYADLRANVRIVNDEYAAANRDHADDLPASGLLASAVAVNEAIIRGNSLSTYAMIATTFGMILYFWRRLAPTLLTMVPVAVAVAVQYYIIAAMDYEVTYVSIILTGMALGIGIDDAVHFVSRFKEEMTHGRSAREAAVLANSEIGRVLVATTVTTLSPFLIIVGSIIVWAENTAWMTIPTLLSALLATIFLLPVLLRWHGERWPGAWVTKADMRRAQSGHSFPEGRHPEPKRV